MQFSHALPCTVYTGTNFIHLKFAQYNFKVLQSPCLVQKKLAQSYGPNTVHSMFVSW